MKTSVSRFIQQEPGATAAEDDLIALPSAIAIAGTATRVGTTLTTVSSSLG